MRRHGLGHQTRAVPPPAPPTVQPKASAPVPAEPADPDKVKHDGGKEDVDAVGNRNVGCKTGWATGMGLRSKSRWEAVLPAGGIQVNWFRIRLFSEYVNRVGQNLVRNSDAAGSVYD